MVFGTPKGVEVVKGKIRRWRRNARHVIVKYDPSGEVAQVECKYNTLMRIRGRGQGPICRCCGRLLDYNTFIDRETFDEHEKIHKQAMKRIRELARIRADKRREEREQEREKAQRKQKVDVDRTKRKWREGSGKWKGQGAGSEAESETEVAGAEDVSGQDEA